MKFLQTISSNKRYFLVGFILILVFLSGKNYDSGAEMNPDLQKQVENLKNELKQKDAIIISSQSKSGEKVIGGIGIGGIGKGNFYRLFFDIDVRDLNSSDQTKSVNFSVFLVSDTGLRQLLDQLEVQNNQIIKNRPVEFQAKDDSNRIIFEKDSIEFSPTINISSIEISSLDVKDLPELKKLDKTSLGIIAETISLERGKTASDQFVLRSKNQSVGEFFTPTQKIVTGADFKLRFIGSGGLGSYFVELREAENEESKVGKLISKYYFNKETANDYLKVGPSTYHFPIAANLVAGQRYYIGISNAEVETNFFHTLAVIAGSPTDSKTEFGAETIGGKYKKPIGDLFLKIYSPLSESPLLGERFEDIGAGRIKYTYKQSGKPEDLLDVSSLSGDGIYFDSNYGGIVGKSENNNQYVFRFDIKKPIRKAGIELSDLSQGIVNSLIYYSFDGKNWQEIPVSEINFATTGKFNQALSLKGESSDLYIKITYDPSDVKYKSFQFFGIQSLQITIEADK